MVGIHGTVWHGVDCVGVVVYRSQHSLVLSLVLSRSVSLPLCLLWEKHQIVGAHAMDAMLRRRAVGTIWSVDDAGRRGCG
jgi:hypothetical protein